MAKPTLSHLDEEGQLSMVDVGEKASTARSATARAHLRASPDLVAALFEGRVKKGEALIAAKVAGIQAAKKTGEWIPLCHPLNLTHVEVHFVRLENDTGIGIQATARTVGPTGVEMEALTAVSAAGLTLYDMGKAAERGMTLEAIRLVEKRGGKSGHWRRDGEVDWGITQPPGD
jgi:cyclic pyranopterin phosphate synthase